MIKFLDQGQMERQIMALPPHASAQKLSNDLARLEDLVRKLQADQAELLDIAFNLSRAVTRFGNSAISIEACEEGKDVIAAAQKSQQGLQDWINRNMGGT